MPLDNTGKHIQSIISRVECKKHRVPEGIPCYHLRLDSVEGYGAGVCGPRIKLAGFVGQISAMSLRKTETRGRGGQPRR